MDLIEIGQILGRIEQKHDSLRDEIRLFAETQDKHHKNHYETRDEFHAFKNKATGIKSLVIFVAMIAGYLAHFFTGKGK